MTTETAISPVVPYADADLRSVDGRELVSLVLAGADVTTVLERLAGRLGISLSLVRADGLPLFHAPVGDDSREDVLSGLARALWRGVDAPSVSVPLRNSGRGLRLTMPCLDRSLTEAEWTLLTQGSELLALSMFHGCEEELLLARERGDFLAALWGGKLTEVEAEAHVAELDWPGSMTLLPIVVSGRGAHEIGARQADWAAILAALRSALAEDGVPMLTGLIDGGRVAVAIVGFHEQRAGTDIGREGLGLERVSLAERVDTVFRRLAQQQIPESGGEVHLCVGESAHMWTLAAAQLREAAELSTVAVCDPPHTWVDLERPDVDLLISRLVGTGPLEWFAQRRLMPLERYDLTHKTDLVSTLATWFDHAGNKTFAARALSIERQSLYGRLQRIEELLGESLADGGTQLGLQLALHVRRSRSGFLSRSEDRGDAATQRACRLSCESSLAC